MNRTFVLFYFGLLLIITIVLFLVGEYLLGVLIPLFCAGYFLLAQRYPVRGSEKRYRFYGDDFDREESQSNDSDRGSSSDSGDSGDSSGSND